MAELAYKATVQTNREQSVARSTGTSILGGATAALIIDNTKSKLEIQAAAEALLRALSRDAVLASSPAGYPTTTTTVE